MPFSAILKLFRMPIDVLQVIQKVGLCICMYDLLKASDGLIGHGTGLVNVNGEQHNLVQYLVDALCIIQLMVLG